MLTFIIENLPYLIISAIGLVTAIIIFFVNLANGKSFKSSFAQLKEDIESMKYRTADYQQQKNGTAPGQSFTPYRKDYFYDRSTGELVEKELPVNVQDQIDSYKDVALKTVLNRLLPPGDEDDSAADDYYRLSRDLDTMLEAHDVAEEFKERYGLDEDLDMYEVFDIMEERAKSMRADLVKKSELLKAEAEIKAEEVKNTVSPEQGKGGSDNVQTSEKKSNENTPQA